MRTEIGRGVALTIVCTLFSYLLLLFFAPPLVEFKNGILRISDFAYYMVLARAFWFEGHKGFYNFAENMQVIQDITAPDFQYLMPMAVTPVSLFLFLPFSLFSYQSMLFAQALWNGCSLSLLISALNRGQLVRREISRSNLPAQLCLMIFCLSYNLKMSLFLGQTSLFFLAALTYFAFVAEEKMERLLTLFLGLVVCAKPTYFLLAFMLLLSLRSWRLARRLAITGLLCTSLFTALAGPRWVIEYYESFLVFSSYPLPEFVRSAFFFPNMNIFRTAMSGLIEEGLAVRLSKICLLLGGGVCALMLVWDLLRSKTGGLGYFLGFLASYMLFAPYLGMYEDILLLFPILLILYKQDVRKQDSPINVGVLLFLLLALLASLNFFMLSSGLTPLGLWFIKAGILFFAVASARRSGCYNLSV